jgi:Fur family ferric uptake transcriptional regulator
LKANPAAKTEAESFERLLARRGLKVTYERKCIFDEVSNLREHFDADSLYERLKKSGLRIARDTVYRTIPLLLEGGIIQKSVGNGKREFYERVVGKGHHDHMVCVACHRFIEFQCDAIEKAQEEVCRGHGFKLTFHDHKLFGYCRECLAKNNS